MKNKLLSSTIYLYILAIVKMVFPLATLPYLTRIFSVELYGFVAYVKTYMSYVQLILDFGFLLSATKNIAIAKEKDSRKIEYIFCDTLAEKFLLLFVVAVITFCVSLFIPILDENKTFLWIYFIAISLTILLPDFLYRGIERMECVTIPYTVAKVISVILTLLLIKNDGDLMLIPVFEIISNAIAVLISFIILKQLNIHIRFSNFKIWLRDLKESGIYFISNFATSVFGALTTIIVGILLNETNVAFWSICMQIVSAAKSLYAPITNSIYPYMITTHDLKLVAKIGKLMSIPMVIGSALVLLFGEQIMLVIGGEKYRYAGYILKLLLPVIVVSFYSMLYGWPVLGAIGKVRQTTISTVVAAVIQMVGIALIYCLGMFNLVSLAICCGISEIILLVIRCSIVLKSCKSF